jgi:ubiquinone/menaquinone biosynthesis C-methylase UbiE
MSNEQSVSQHYAHGSLEHALLAPLKAAGKDIERLSHADLAPVDEFHIGGRQATTELAAQIDLPSGARVLDVGCGVGGPARYFAAERGWKVDGIDLTPEFVDVATRLSRRAGLSHATSYRVASATNLPFADKSFDGAYMLHVGMNIADKKAVFAEVHRVLKPGGVFAIYDIMRESDGGFVYPVPWSSEPATNAIDRPANYRKLLEAAGFRIDKERSRRDFALGIHREAIERLKRGERLPAPPVMGPTGPQKVANMVGLLERGVIAPVEIVSRA